MGCRNALRISNSLSYFLVIILFCGPIKCQCHSLTATLNPGCQSCGSHISVFSVVYRDSIASVHFVISLPTEGGVPSAFVSKSPINSSISFNWTEIQKNGTNNQAIFLENSSFSGISFPFIFQHNAAANRSETSRRIPLHQCFWYVDSWDSLPNPTTGLLSITFRCNDSRPSNIFKKNGSLQLQFIVSEASRRSVQAPHVFMIGGVAVQIRIALNRLKDPAHWTNTQWALGLILLGNYSLPAASVFDNASVVSLDDEPSPGAFKRMTIFLSNEPQAAASGWQSFVDWQFVCYLDEEAANLQNSRTVAVSQQLPMDPIAKRALAKSLVGAVFGVSWTDGSAALRQLNVTFGEPTDDLGAGYARWTLVLGVGVPRGEQFSVLVWSMLAMTCLLAAIALLLTVHMAARCLVRMNQLRGQFRECRLLEDDNQAFEDEVKL